MDKKEQILHSYRVDGLSLREISRRVGLNRKTVTRYVREFEKMSLQDGEDGIEPTESLDRAVAKLIRIYKR